MSTPLDNPPMRVSAEPVPGPTDPRPLVLHVPVLTAPALLADPVLGADGLIYVPRMKLDRPVVYVCQSAPEADAPEGTPPSVWYVGQSKDYEKRIRRHEMMAGSRTSDPSKRSGSGIPPGAWIVTRAQWIAVPVPSEHRRALEDALTVLLRPQLQARPLGRGGLPVKLGRRHVAAMVAAGWTEEAATAWVASPAQDGR